MEGLIYIENFISNPDELFNSLTSKIIWDESMKSRKTASFGKTYNYSQISYIERGFLVEIKNIIKNLTPVIDFKANNCLLNYYLDGKSKMGFHSDKIDILEGDTGIAIVSIGSIRTLRFRSIENTENIVDYKLTPGSLIYMTQNIQKEWMHSIIKSDTENGRISLTFRKIK